MLFHVEGQRGSVSWIRLLKVRLLDMIRATARTFAQHVRQLLIAWTYQRPIGKHNLGSNDAVTCQAMLPHGQPNATTQS